MTKIYMLILLENGETLTHIGGSNLQKYTFYGDYFSDTHLFGGKYFSKVHPKPFGDWGLENLPVPGTEHFLGTFYFFIKPVFFFVMVANSPHYSPYFKSTCPSDHNVIFSFAPPSS